MTIASVCVYCASSRQSHPEYLDAAARLGRLLAREKIKIVYGGGSAGSMGHLADGAIAEQGTVLGVLPQFMYDLEWGHKGLAELRVVNDLHERKRLMIDGVDAIVALPGGSGTLEELLEAITWKRLGLHVHPIVLVNVRGFFDPLVRLLEHAIAEKMMDERHRQMWTVADRPEDVLAAIRAAPPWSKDARQFAAL
ncbi:MAG: TIGR00730 family Rossman fold protein [Planctomycetia bacterium]|nr:TIGR00730 family Rossman fold protein [Planctomycetia bacterium]